MEVFKDIINYEGYYQISNLGNVKSLITNKILKYAIDGNGYKHIALCKNGQRSFRIHKLIANAFISNPENKPCINHKDGNKLNNTISNLEHCTFSENRFHAVKTGLHISAKGEKAGGSKLTEKEVIEIRNLQGKYTKQQIADKFNIGITMIRNIHNYKNWKHI